MGLPSHTSPYIWYWIAIANEHRRWGTSVLFVNKQNCIHKVGCYIYIEFRYIHIKIPDLSRCAYNSVYKLTLVSTQQHSLRLPNTQLYLLTLTNSYYHSLKLIYTHTKQMKYPKNSLLRPYPMATLKCSHA